MATIERVLEGIKQVLLVTEELKRLAESVKALGGEVRDIDRRLSRLEGVVVGQAQGAPSAPRRLPRRDD